MVIFCEWRVLGEGTAAAWLCKFLIYGLLERWFQLLDKSIKRVLYWVVTSKGSLAPRKGILISDQGNFCLWNLESWALESGMQLKESGIPLTIAIRNPSSTDKKSRIQSPRLSWVFLHEARILFWLLTPRRIWSHPNLTLSHNESWDLFCSWPWKRCKRSWKG